MIFQVHTGTKPEKARFRPIENIPYFAKPKGGFWTSTFDTEIVSGWVDWCQSEMPEWGKRPRHYLRIIGKPKILTIHDVSDLELAVDAYPTSDPIFLNKRIIDFVALSRDYDAVHLTDAGQWATRYSEPSLYGWDCESILWLKWGFLRRTTLDRILSTI